MRGKHNRDEDRGEASTERRAQRDKHELRRAHMSAQVEERAQVATPRDKSPSGDTSRQVAKWRHLATTPQVPTPRHMSPHVPYLSRERGKRNSTRRAQRRAQRQAHIRVCADRSTPTDIPKCKRGRMMVSVRGGGWRRTKHVMRLGKHIETITEAST
jgi:hypothetical protein